MSKSRGERAASARERNMLKDGKSSAKETNEEGSTARLDKRKSNVRIPRKNSADRPVRVDRLPDVAVWMRRVERRPVFKI